jgi:hypothetical protein
MPVYQTNELLTKLQQQTEDFLNEAISEWQMMPAETLLHQPAPNQWSGAQCLEHLNSYGRYYLPAIEKAIETGKTSGQAANPNFYSGWLGNYFTNTMKVNAGKMKKMSSPKEHVPIADLDVPKVISEFIDQQEKLLVLLDVAKEIDVNKATVPISIAKFIKLKLGDVFLFLIAHNERHILQAEKAIVAEPVFA